MSGFAAFCPLQAKTNVNLPRFFCFIGEICHKWLTIRNKFDIKKMDLFIIHGMSVPSQTER